MVESYKNALEKQELYIKAVENYERAKTETGESILLGTPSFYNEISYICTVNGIEKIEIKKPRQGTEIDKVELVGNEWYVQRPVDWERIIYLDKIESGKNIVKTLVLGEQLQVYEQSGFTYYNATLADWDNYGLRKYDYLPFVVAKCAVGSGVLYDGLCTLNDTRAIEHVTNLLRIKIENFNQK